MIGFFSRILSLIRAYIGYYFFQPWPLIEPPKDGTTSSHEAKAACRLDVVIVGCGPGGLAVGYCLGKAGHRVTILEAAEALGTIGAGLQAGTNVSRLLIRWGLKEQLDTLAIQPESVSFRRYTGERVGMDIYGPKIEKEYGVPYYQVHRADLHKMLCDIALPLVELRLNSRVVSVSPDPSSPHVVLQSGEVVHADVIIGADGVKSVIRTCLVEGADTPTPTGDAAFRATISTETFKDDPDLKPFFDHPEATVWMGPDKHIVGYNLSNKVFNLAMIHPDPDPDSTESWTAPGDVAEMRKLYEGWDPRVCKMLGLVKSVLKSRLMVRQPLKTWVHSGGRVALLGDACHPMLPYRGQGAALAIEDAAVLGNLFTRITEKSQIPALLKAYESLRYDRATVAQLASLSMRSVLHQHDGPGQQKRDAGLREAMELTLRAARGEEIPTDAYEGNLNPWLDKTKKDSVLKYDADDAVEQWWKEHGASIASDE